MHRNTRAIIQTAVAIPGLGTHHQIMSTASLPQHGSISTERHLSQTEVDCGTRQAKQEPLRIQLVSLFSSRYPAAGETHGLSVVAGTIHHKYSEQISEFNVLDLVTLGKEEASIVLSAIDRTAPNIIGISTPYGTYDLLIQLKDRLRSHIDNGGLLLIGGPLATYIGERILDEIDSRAIIIQGEGDDAAPAVIAAWRCGQPLDSIPNILYTENRNAKKTRRSLVTHNSLAVPYRSHLRHAINQGIQVYCEASRGCSWAACTFCLRGLTDIKGTAREYRGMPISRLVDDLLQLKKLGANQVTFADEDFIGADPESMSELIAALRSIQSEHPGSRLSFDVSATTRSIYDEDDPAEVADRKLDQLIQLKKAGLNKVFLGVESGSPTQLKRYAKGHTPSEVKTACNAVLKAGLKLELGFIMFDPLCTSGELVENVDFLLESNLASSVSAPTSELRLQVGSRYIHSLKRAERSLGRQLFSRAVDPNTLSHAYEYASHEVGSLARAVRTWDNTVHAFVYATKGLTRHGHGILTPSVHHSLKLLLGNYREACLRSLRSAAACSQPDLYRTGTISALLNMIKATESVAAGQTDGAHPMVSTLTNEALTLSSQLR